MKKISSLFKRDYEGNRLVYDETVEGSEWVLRGEGVPTIKIDGTSCTLIDGIYYKRYDRKLTKKSKRNPKSELTESDFKSAPDGWLAAENSPNLHTGHWPGWMPIGDGPEDQWHREAIETHQERKVLENMREYGETDTFELIGPKVQGNPYGLDEHIFVSHSDIIREEIELTFYGIRKWLENNEEEGIVWHHLDGRMVKIKRRDFGLKWPLDS